LTPSLQASILSRMPTIHLTDIYGQQHTIEAEPGVKLMEILREYEFGVIASCGGFLSCATCHVYIDPSWIDRLPDMQFDERELVSILTTYRPGTSRLTCQVPFTAELDGIELTVAPEE
jgi:2Fe-2S ferredoxin